MDLESVDAIRAVLDRFDVGGRLKYVREFIWRGGHLELYADRRADGQACDVGYALAASWPAAVLEERGSMPGILPRDRSVVDGRWMRGTRGYELRAGIDLRVPSAIYLRAQGLLSYVPFMGRSAVEVEEALARELSAYVSAFVSRCPPVPQAEALDAHRLRQLGLNAA